MPRTNIAGDWCGESFRLTVRLSPLELKALDDLCSAWTTERSDAVRRALRHAAAFTKRQHADELLAAIPVMSVAELRRLATRLSVPGRSRMSKSQLRAAISAAVRLRYQ